MRTTSTGRVAAVALAAALLALSACSGEGDDDSAPDEPAAASPDAPAAPSAGCDAAEPVPAGDERVTTTSGGGERWYLRHVPEAHDGRTPVPLVVDIHGYSEGAEVHAQQSGLAAYGDREGFITLTPQGRGDVPLWNVTPDGEDMTFIGDMLDEAEAELCVDTNRVYVAGLSNGGFMTSAVACAYADRVAAVAPVAGIRPIDGCEPARPVPVVTFHGTEDQFVAFEGGSGPAAAALPAPDGSGRTLAELQASGDPGGVTGTDPAPGDPTVPEIVAAWAERNGCDAEPRGEDVARDVTLEGYTCPDGADVAFYRIEGGGHTWPGSEFSASIESIVGPTTMSISANEVMWAFFRDHPLTG